MKKMSINLFAVLHIALAISSAFTTKSSNFSRDTYEIWTFGSYAPDKSFFPFFDSDAQYDYINDWYYLPTSYYATWSTTIEDILTTNSLICVDNWPEPDKICAAKVFRDYNYDRTVDGVGEVVDVMFGDLENDW